MLDLLVLIATTALGFGLIRLYNELDDRPSPSYLEGEFYWGWWSLLVFATTLGISAVRVRAPRPTIRRLAREPGFVASVAILIVAALNVMASIRAVLVQSFFLPFGREDVLDIVLWSLHDVAGHDSIGPAVALGWMILALQRPWRRRADWVEWSGRALGALAIGSWIIPGAIGWCKLILAVLRR